MSQAVNREQAASSLDSQELIHFIYGGASNYNELLPIYEYLHKTVDHDMNIYGEGRINQMKRAIKQFFYVPDQFCRRQSAHIADYIKDGPGKALTPIFIHLQHQSPATVHIGMFVPCIKIMGTDEQQKELLGKCQTFEIIGCYAQTQMGHGSDVQSLQTTATFDKESDTIILNTPSITATKFWPGDMGLFATHALIFASLLVDGNSLGVHPFLVQIRDNRNQPMPGVECGDIGPHAGYITKDNGFLILKNVKIPRTNMLGRIAKLTRQGDLEIQGNPKIMYATMMLTRRIISTMWPKIYGQGITIATRYSIFRTQFKSGGGSEIPILDYQLQQDKLIPLMSEFVAISVAGNEVAQLSDLNLKMVSENNDDSLMAETHATLCYAKAFYSDIVCRGLDICRRACGGHGFSHYSGMPGLVEQYHVHPTHQGENTILYLQTGRYIVKTYRQLLKDPKRTVQKSVNYLVSRKHLLQRVCATTENNAQQWNLEEIRTILAQNVIFCLEQYLEKCKQFKGTNSKEVDNYHTGIRLVRLSVAHSLYNTYRSFSQATFTTTMSETLRQVLTDLCLLFGINQILLNPTNLALHGAIQPHHLTSLQVRKQRLLKNLRPHASKIVRGFGIPSASLKSALVLDKPYQTMLQWASKRNPINSQVQPAVFYMKENLRNLHPKL